MNECLKVTSTLRKLSLSLSILSDLVDDPIVLLLLLSSDCNNLSGDKIVRQQSRTKKSKTPSFLVVLLGEKLPLPSGNRFLPPLLVLPGDLLLQLLLRSLGRLSRQHLPFPYRYHVPAAVFLRDLGEKTRNKRDKQRQR